MANEITVNVAISISKDGVTVPAGSGLSSPIGQSAAGTFTMTGNNFVENIFSVPTSQTAIPMGSVTAPHWAFFWNLDATNFVTIRGLTSGTDNIKLLAGEFALVPLNPSQSAPFALADTAPVKLRYLIVSL